MICDGMCYLLLPRQSFRIRTLHYNNSFLHNFLLFSIVGSTTCYNRQNSYMRMRENGHHEIFLSESQILKF